ncbi:MAG: tRNA (adenosine(37)-N6)-threonylcarbamoyltransferase complex ATPase subunit type 1 TsaE [Planctomycetaceae bacterium]|nr:tRNA (adenosine(37)-N6)-threonylcarbamoyltransferase complex ATPase subunit type 1 TsaE [Planctomycetaceae bacterium]
MTYHYHSDSLSRTEKLARHLALLAPPGTVIALNGTLGAGKTAFSRAFAEALGVDENAVSSPTYSLIQHYLGDQMIHHLDLYRIESPEELYELGIEELLEGKAISLVEWSNKYPEVLPQDYLEINIESLGDSERRILLQPTGKRSCDLLERLSQDLPDDLIPENKYT